MQKLKQWLSWREIFSRNKKIEITVETKQVLKIRRLKKHNQKFCLLCREATVFVAVEDAAVLIETDLSAIEILLANGKIHFIEAAEGENFICLNSLEKAVGQTPRLGSETFDRQNEDFR